MFDYLLADEVPHVHNGARWGTHLLGGDEQAYRDKVRELRAGLDRTGTPVLLLEAAACRGPRRPVLPLLETAFWEVWNGLRSEPAERDPAPCPAPRLPRPRTFWPPRSGWRDRRGARKARISSRMQKRDYGDDGHGSAGSLPRSGASSESSSVDQPVRRDEHAARGGRRRRELAHRQPGTHAEQLAGRTVPAA